MNNMSYDTHTVPLKTRNKSEESCDTGNSCSSCGSGCSGGLVEAGSEKYVVYRNVLIFTLVALVFVTVTYSIMQLLRTIAGVN
jgi:hypothetical protein